MNEITKYLLELQTLETTRPAPANSEATIAELRRKIPVQVLAHYDRLRARGKLGLAAVRRQVCTGCHMQVCLATTMTLKRGDDIRLCDNCGRYLYLPEEPVAEPAAAPAAARAASTRRKRRTARRSA